MRIVALVIAGSVLGLVAPEPARADKTVADASELRSAVGSVEYQPDCSASAPVATLEQARELGRQRSVRVKVDGSPADLRTAGVLTGLLWQARMEAYSACSISYYSDDGVETGYYGGGAIDIITGRDFEGVAFHVDSFTLEGFGRIEDRVPAEPREVLPDASKTAAETASAHEPQAQVSDRPRKTFDEKLFENVAWLVFAGLLLGLAFNADKLGDVMFGIGRAIRLTIQFFYSLTPHPLHEQIERALAGENIDIRAFKQSRRYRNRFERAVRENQLSEAIKRLREREALLRGEEAERLRQAQADAFSAAAAKSGCDMTDVEIAVLNALLDQQTAAARVSRLRRNQER